MTAEPGPAAPLWSQVLSDLRRRIASGEFAERFPGDLELVEQYGVSRHTVREAVRHLQDGGTLERRRGLGSRLVGRGIEQPLGTLYSLFRSVEAAGMTQRSVVVHLDRRQDDAAAAMLERPGEELVYLQRVRLADGSPIALDASWMPAALAAPLLEADFGHTALYEELAERCGVHPGAGWERIRPVLPTPAERELLHLGPRKPALAVERLTYGPDDTTPVEWRKSVVRGDRFTFVARWGAAKIDTTFEPVPPEAGPAG